MSRFYSFNIGVHKVNKGLSNNKSWYPAVYDRCFYDCLNNDKDLKKVWIAMKFLRHKSL